MGGFVGAPKPGSPAAAAVARAQRIGVYSSGEVALVNNTPVAVDWTNENFKFEITHSNVTDPEDLVVAVAGRYLVTAAASITFEGAAGGAAGYLGVLVDNVLVAQNSESTPSTDVVLSVPMAVILDLAVGAIVNLRVLVLFGAGTATLSTVSTLTRLEMHRLS